MAPPRIPLSVRFWAKVQKTDNCWNWTGFIDHDGYGRTSTGGRSTSARAHRVVWEVHFGKIPNGLWVLHHCDNPSCVRPEHLFLGTHLDNVRDKTAKERQARGTRLSKLTEANVLTIRSRYAAGGIFQQALADEYGVDQPAIWKILHRKTWRHLK